jgi:hypothetical protein
VACFVEVALLVEVLVEAVFLTEAVFFVEVDFLVEADFSIEVSARTAALLGDVARVPTLGIVVPRTFLTEPLVGIFEVLALDSMAARVVVRVTAPTVSSHRGSPRHERVLRGYGTEGVCCVRRRCSRGG